MKISELTEYRDLLIQDLDDLGLSVSFGDNLNSLLETYEAATGTGYVQLPFVLDSPQDVASPHNFWVGFDDGNEPMALTGMRTLRNGHAITRVGEAFSRGVLYRQEAPGREGWWPHSGPELAPGALYSYIGAGWVHPRFRGQNLAGYIARIAQVEAVIRTHGALAMVTAMTTETLFRSGMNLRASGLHHMHVEQVLEGHFQVVHQDLRLYLSHSTTSELCEFYEGELALLRKGDAIPWLHQHDRTFAPDALVQMQARALSRDPVEPPVSALAELA